MWFSPSLVPSVLLHSFRITFYLVSFSSTAAELSCRCKCAQSPEISNCSRSDISRRLGAGADSLADPGPDGELLAEAPVIPALRVPARELARRPGEPAAAERYPERGATTAPRLPRDTDAVDAASGPQHTGDHPRAQLRHQ